MTRAQFVRTAILAGVLQFGVYLVLFAIGFAMGDSASGTVPWPLNAAVAVLSAPLMYLMNVALIEFGSHAWWGDDNNLFICLAALNAALWGTTIAALIRRFGRHPR